MKTIIAGPRDFEGVALVHRTIDIFQGTCGRITEVVSGGATGVDRIAEDWARDNDIPVNRFPADWKTHGKSAGPIRNREMAQYADALIAVWDGKSPGTRNMIQEAEKRRIPVIVQRFTPQQLPAAPPEPSPRNP